MGTLGENGYENLGMMIQSIEMFWHVLCNTMVDDETERGMSLDFDKNRWLGSDSIPLQFYRTTTIPELGRA